MSNSENELEDSDLFGPPTEPPSTPFGPAALGDTLRGRRIALGAWNMFLPLFSLTVTVRIGVAVLYVASHLGFGFSTCAIGIVEEPKNPTAYLRTVTFSYSKILEFGDTNFILLRKQKLIFLHWYHHASILLFT
ncbi:unnamed protein product [Darwinula stevensoni]|uniref:Elongation of very long chain fatty acids protein n=1 Tax=Darwinula stevensoni TaxID=69355 RepID=A0A7R8XCB9_9CRUS|nr:unnamed protein product [Darwinula stevensoni]CAG0891837.1 unnamed protein product [Darwinula stevensoni]